MLASRDRGGNRGRGRGGRGGTRGERGDWAAELSPTAAAQPVQVVPPMNDLRWQHFRNTVKKRSCNFFEYHRRGLSRDPTAPWDDPNNLPLFREPEGSWDGRYWVDVPATLRAQGRSRVGYERFGGAEEPAMRQKRLEAEAAAEIVRDRLAQLGVTVRLVKVLGFGGNGVASLFEVWPEGDCGLSKKVVVKSLLRKGGNMSAERSYNMVRETSCIQQKDRCKPRMRLIHGSFADEEVLS